MADAKGRMLTVTHQEVAPGGAKSDITVALVCVIGHRFTTHQPLLLTFLFPP